MIELITYNSQVERKEYYLLERVNQKSYTAIKDMILTGISMTIFWTYGFKNFTWTMFAYKLLGYYYDRMPVVIKNPYENPHDIAQSKYLRVGIMTSLTAAIIRQPEKLD